MAKNNLKSVRLSDEVLQIVESYNGEGFNQKFENLVIDFKKTLLEREAYKKVLDKQIAGKQKELQKLSHYIIEASNVKTKLDMFINSLSL